MKRHLCTRRQSQSGAYGIGSNLALQVRHGAVQGGMEPLRHLPRAQDSECSPRSIAGCFWSKPWLNMPAMNDHRASLTQQYQPGRTPILRAEPSALDKDNRPTARMPKGSRQKMRP